jgi:hypothetical protein
MGARGFVGGEMISMGLGMSSGDLIARRTCKEFGNLQVAFNKSTLLHRFDFKTT